MQHNYTESPEFLSIKNGEQVSSYRDSLSLLYMDPRMAHLARNHWKVAEIKTYTDESTKAKHEYLIATLSDGDRPAVFLRMERRIHNFFRGLHIGHIPPGQRDAAQPEDERETHFRRNVMDEVSLVTPNVANFGKQQLIQHTVFENESRVSLPQFIVLACAVNEYTKQCHFFETSCYWFCYLIGELLQRLSAPSFPDLSARGRQDTWLGLPASSLWREIDFDVLSEKYNTMWNAFENQIESIINHPDNKHLNPKTQAQEEKERAAGAECCMEEENCHAEGSEWQLAELKA